MDRQAILAEIEQMTQQRNEALDVAQQANGAIQALNWVLSQMGEESPVMTEQQFIDAVQRGQNEAN